jgi:glycosyltransferase involved in cell wall biosynthesis
VVVFAHTPPPHHGQSAMVQLMLDLLQPAPAAATGPLRLFHVNARVSHDIAEVGDFRPGKIATLLAHCRQALRLRREHGARSFYYVPAPPARTPLWRDWLVMALCRPFFPRLIFHWHAGGLSEWLERRASAPERWLTRCLLGRHDLSIVLRPFHRRDAEYLAAREIRVIPNGLPDPCPDFATALLPERRAAAAARQQALRAGPSGTPHVARVLYLSLLRREKGLFDALEAVVLANARLRQTGLRFELIVAGDFASPAVRAEFEARVQAPDLVGPPPVVRAVGFVTGAAKDRLWREADCLCFPTRLPEGFPVTLAEAMAYGLPVVTSDCCGLPEILPPGWPGVFATGNAADLAARLLEWAERDYHPDLREWYLAHYTAERFAKQMRDALLAGGPGGAA